MHLTPSVPNLCTLIYLSVRGCRTWQSAVHPQGVPSYNLAASYLPSLSTAETKILRLGKLHLCKHLQILQRSLALVTLR